MRGGDLGGGSETLAVTNKRVSWSPDVANALGVSPSTHSSPNVASGQRDVVVFDCYNQTCDPHVVKTVASRNDHDTTSVVCIPVTTTVTTFPLDSQNWGEGHNSGGKGFGESGDPSFTITKGHSHAAATVVATVVAIQDGRGLDKAQNGKGFSEDDVAYTVDTHATQAVAIQGTVIGREDHNGPQGSGFDETGACFTLTKTDNHAVAYCMTTAMTPKFAEELSPTLMLPSETGGGQCTAVVTSQYSEIAGSLTARHDSSPCADRGQNCVAYKFDSLSSNSMKSSNPHSGCNAVEVSHCLDTTTPEPSKNQGGIAIVHQYAVRRLTPTECARLQGFPDDHCKITFRGKPAADGPQYKAYGNSMAVPCMRWIGERIENYLFEV